MSSDSPSSSAEEASSPSAPLSSPTAEDKIKAWEEQVREHQQDFANTPRWDRYLTRLPSVCCVIMSGWCSCLENMDEFENSYELDLLKRNKIGFSLFGLPAAPITEYDSHQQEEIIAVFDVIMEHRRDKANSEVLVAVVWIYVLTDCGKQIRLPVFRIPNPKTDEHPPKNYWFIDHSCRIYKNWEDYLKNNELPKGRFCYLENGVYTTDSSEVKVEVQCTPASSLISNVARGMDIGTSVVGVGAGVVFVATQFTGVPAFFTAGSAVGAGVSGVYSALRGSINQADRGMHGQSIGLADRASRRNWLSIVGSALGLGASGGMMRLSALAAKGKVVTDLAPKIVNGLNASSLVVNGIGIVDNAHELFYKDEVSTLECAQLVASVIFFCNSVMSVKTAQSVIENTQKEIIDSHKASLRSNRHRKIFQAIEKATMKGKSNEVGRAQVIRGVNHISNVDEAYAHVLRSRKVYRADGVKVTFGDGGLEVNGKTLGSGATSFCPTVRHVIGEVHSASSGAVVCRSVSNGREGSSSSGNQFIEGLFKFLLECARDGRTVSVIVENLKQYCSQKPYGEWIFKCITMVTRFKNCQTVDDYGHWAVFVVEEFETLYLQLKQKLLAKNIKDDNVSGNPPNSVSEEEEEVLLNEACDPLLCYAIIRSGYTHGQEINREEVSYHFPEHMSWGPQGELELE